MSPDPLHRPAPPAAVLAGEVALAAARVHEAAGPARRTFAMLVAGAMEGPVFWIQPAWRVERMNPEGMLGFANPGRFLFLYPRRPEDLLWTMEECLRAGAVPLVVAELTAPPGLTPVRRLHLAAETGAGRGKLRPLGLLLTPGEGGAQGVESRWRMAGRHDAGPGHWQLTRARARALPPKSWTLTRRDGRVQLAAAAEAA